MLTPHQCEMAATDSVRMARASSGVTANAPLPPWPPRMSGHGIGPSLQAQTFPLPRRIHVSVWPRRTLGGRYGPCRSANRFSTEGGRRGVDRLFLTLATPAYRVVLLKCRDINHAPSSNSSASRSFFH